MVRLLTTLFLLLALTGSTHPALAQEQTPIEERARALDKQLICPVCPGETLHQSQATLAKQMRQILRDRLAEGQSEQEIVAYFVSVYGDSVLAAPPREGFGLIAWLVPPLALAIGGVIVFFTIRALRKAPTLAPGLEPPMPSAEAMTRAVELERYLKLVDQEMGGKGDNEQPNTEQQKPNNG